MTITRYAGDRFAGLSTDTKPSSVDGALFLELDTGKLFYREDADWESVIGEASPAGPDRSVQFNNDDSFGGSENFVFVDGKVGINTDNPAELLTVRGPDAYVHIRSQLATNNAVHNSGIKFVTDVNTRYASIQVVRGGGSHFTGLQFRTHIDDEHVDALRIAPDGNVGIGTVSPDDKLHVAGGVARFTGIAGNSRYNFTNQGSSNQWTQINLNSEGNLASDGNGGAYFMYLASDNLARLANRANGPLEFWTNNTLRAWFVADGTLRLAPPASSGSLHLEFNHGYQLYIDNAGAGSDNTRFWLNVPNNGEIVLGPRSGSAWTHQIRHRASLHSFEVPSVGIAMNINQTRVRVFNTLVIPVK